MGEEKLRIEEDESNTRKRLKEMREDHKKWEETRDNRVRCPADMPDPSQRSLTGISPCACCAAARRVAYTVVAVI